METYEYLKNNSFCNDDECFLIKDFVDYYLRYYKDRIEWYENIIRKLNEEKYRLGNELFDKKNKKTNLGRNRIIVSIGNEIDTINSEIITEIKEKIFVLESILNNEIQVRVIPRNEIKFFARGKNIIEIQTIGKGELNGGINGSNSISGGSFLGFGSIQGSGSVSGRIHGEYVEDVLIKFKYELDYKINKKIFDDEKFFGEKFEYYHDDCSYWLHNPIEKIKSECFLEQGYDVRDDGWFEGYI